GMQLFSRKPRVLVLDDDVSMQKLVSMLLKREGYRIDVVDSGRKAIESIDKNDYTAILLDLMMPHEGGMTVLTHLRQKSPEVLQRVILLTAMPDSILKGIAKDVFAVVRKPFEASDLVATVARLA
ncbi:MAG TPA: response regulator, partial [Thermoanaerobaculia bacterium]